MLKGEDGGDRDRGPTRKVPSGRHLTVPLSVPDNKHQWLTYLRLDKRTRATKTRYAKCHNAAIRERKVISLDDSLSQAGASDDTSHNGLTTVSSSI